MCFWAPPSPWPSMAGARYGTALLAVFVPGHFIGLTNNFSELQHNLRHSLLSHMYQTCLTFQKFSLPISTPSSALCFIEVTPSPTHVKLHLGTCFLETPTNTTELWVLFSSHLRLLRSRSTHEVSRGLDFSRWAWRSNREAKEWGAPSICRLICQHGIHVV